MRRLRDLLTEHASVAAALPDVARGLRAAVVTLAPFYLATVLHRPELTWTALAGWLGTLVDPGGSRRTRAWALAVFGVAGAAAVAGSEAAAGRVAAGLLAAVAFAAAIVRGVGATAGSVGTMAAMVAAIGTARVSGRPGRDAAFFALGAAQALFLSTVVWPVGTHLPVRRAIARAYEALGAYASDVGRAEVLAAPADDARWGALIERHHRRIREASEAARQVALAARARRVGETRFGSNVRGLLASAEAQFPVLGTLVQELEALPAGARGGAGERLGEIAAVYAEVERILLARALRSGAPARRVARGVEGGEGGSTADGLARRLAGTAHEALEVACALDAAVGAPAVEDAPPSRAIARSAREALRGWGRALGDALSPRSAFLRHAIRVAGAVTVASFAGSLVSPSRGYWVTLTAIAVLQPDIGATLRRAFERVAGTVLGSAVAAAIIVSVRSPLVLAALMVPLSVAAVATRPRSYRLFTFFLTPVFVLLAERHPGDWWTAATRVGDVALGGVIALVASAFVLPSSERGRLPDALAAMLSAVAAYTRTVIEAAPARRAEGADTGVEARVEEGRRAASVAVVAAEASLERLRAVPLGDQSGAVDSMRLVTWARRLARALWVVVRVAWTARQCAAALARVGAYVAAAVEAAEARVRGERVAAAPLAPEGIDHAALGRVVRQAALVASVGGGERAAGAAA